MDKCPITGGNCHCEPKLASSPLGAALLIDLRAALRKVISDRAWYLSFLICESIPVKASHVSILNRLFRTTEELCNLLEPIIGSGIVEPLSNHLNEHLRVTANLLESTRDIAFGRSSNTKIFEIQEQLSSQQKKIGLYLGKINDTKLSCNHAFNLIMTHDKLVYELIVHRRNGIYDAYNDSLDRLTKHSLIIADAIYESLTL